MADFVLHRTDDAGFDLWWLGGQSNMSGRGAALNTARLDLSDPRIWQYSDAGTLVNTVNLAVDPLDQHDGLAQLGPGLSFARLLLAATPPNRKILLVPTAHGGTKLSDTGVLAWRPSGDPGNLYQQAMAQVAAALTLAGPNARVAGAVWLQGESDGDASTSAATYRTDMLALIDGFRGLFGAGVPFLVAQMVPDFLVSAGGTRAAINAVHIDLARLRTRVAFAYGPTGSANNNGDGNHYSAPGQRLLARAVNDAVPLARANVTGTAPIATPAPALTQSGTSLAVAWSRPACRFTDWNARYRAVGAGSWTAVTRTTPNLDVTAAITGLSSGSTYEVQVQTVNEQGLSAWSPSATITLTYSPAAPTALTAGVAGSTQQPLTWTAPSVDATHSAALSYLVEYRLHGAGSWTAGPTVTATSATVTGLAPESSYDYQVTGINAAGAGTPSSATTASTAALSALVADVGVSAWGAWSIGRRVVTGYNGALITVRRDSDNTAADIGMAAGQLDQSALLTFVGAGNGFVTKLWDQSGNARHFVQATNANQPQIVAGGVVNKANGQPCVTNTVTTGWAQANVGLYAAGAMTQMAVFQANSGPQPIIGEQKANAAYPLYWPMLAWTSGTTLGRGISGDAGTANAATAVTAVQKVLNDKLHQATGVDTGTGLLERLDGLTLDNATYARTNALTQQNSLSLFCTTRSTTTVVGIAGNFCEAAAWSSALTSGQYAAGEGNQKAFYGTP